MKRSVAAWLLAGALAASALAGCTTIPTGSSPDVVRSLPAGTSTAAAHPNLTPVPGAGPHDVVQSFIDAGVDADAGHSTARQFLTTTAARKWQDDPTVIVDATLVGQPSISGNSATVPVTGRRVGLLNANGVFSPMLKGMGTGDEETFSYALIKVGGQWRIDQLQPGVLIAQASFSSIYRARQLYFFDSAESILVPDLRYTPLEGQPLASWLLAQLLAGPRPELAQSVTNEVPDQVGKPSVQIGDPITVELPGTQQLDAAGRNGLAAQLAYTFGQVQFAQLRLTDSGRTVRIPQAQGDTFSSLDFTSAGPANSVPGAAVYFLRDGSVYGSDGTPLKNELGQPGRNLTSIAIRQSGISMEAAGVTTAGKLVLGDESRLVPVSLPQRPVSRPEWNPQGDEVWVGVGNHNAIYRVVSGQHARPVSVTSQVVGLPNGQVTTIRFSPDGVRVALVIKPPNSHGTVWIGSVVASGSDVRIDSLEPITPGRMAVTDLAWADPTKLLIIAAAPGAQAEVSEMLSDGSLISAQSNSGLPGTPTAITAALQENPVVAANGYLMQLNGSGWTNLNKSKTPVPGTNPIYAP